MPAQFREIHFYEPNLIKYLEKLYIICTNAIYSAEPWVQLHIYGQAVLNRLALRLL